MVDLPDIKCVEPNELFQSIRVGNVSRVKELLDRGEELEQKNYYWFSPLLYAVSYNQRAICEELLARGANINAQDKRGFSCLHQAALKDYEELYQFLLQKGANCHLLNLAEEKPYQVAYTKERKVKYAKLAGIPYQSRWGETVEEAMDIYAKQQARRKQESQPSSCTTSQ